MVPGVMNKRSGARKIADAAVTREIECERTLEMGSKDHGVPEGDPATVRDEMIVACVITAESGNVYTGADRSDWCVRGTGE